MGKPFHGEHNEVDERDVSPDYLADAEGAAGARAPDLPRTMMLEAER